MNPPLVHARQSSGLCLRSSLPPPTCCHGCRTRWGWLSTKMKSANLNWNRNHHCQATYTADYFPSHQNLFHKVHSLSLSAFSEPNNYDHIKPIPPDKSRQGESNPYSSVRICRPVLSQDRGEQLFCRAANVIEINIYYIAFPAFMTALSWKHLLAPPISVLISIGIHFVKLSYVHINAD